jgi:hypothetical protein
MKPDQKLENKLSSENAEMDKLHILRVVGCGFVLPSYAIWKAKIRLGSGK